jgi:hypothetical protein
MQMKVDPDTQSSRPFFARFTPEAERLWAAWFNSHADETEALDFPDDLAGAWSKMKTHAARFALILSRLWTACGPTPKCELVDAPHVQGAEALVTYFKAHAERARHEMTDGVGSMDAKAVLDWLRRTRRTTFREADVSADLRRFRANPRALAGALKALRSAGVIRPRDAATASRPGPKGTPTYEVHPDIARAPEFTGNPANASERQPEPDDPGNHGNSRRVGAGGGDGREVVEL